MPTLSTIFNFDLKILYGSKYLSRFREIEINLGFMSIHTTELLLSPSLFLKKESKSFSFFYQDLNLSNTELNNNELGFYL